jgi:hypothetical protein
VVAANATQSSGQQSILNYTTMNVTLEMETGPGLLSPSQGNLRSLNNGDKFIGWGGQW